MNGRPLRFVALVAAGWAGARVFMLWPEGANLPEAIEEAFPIQEAAAAATPVLARPASRMARPLVKRVLDAAGPARSLPAMAAAMPGATIERSHVELAAMNALPVRRDESLGVPVGAVPHLTPRLGVPASAQPSPWSASAWLVTRRGAPAGGTMLGGDQAGVRVAYALDDAQQMRLYLRATAPLATSGRELAVGAEWQPTKAPVRIAGEYRQGLDGQASGPALGVVGGVDSIAVPFDFKLEAYGAAGAVWRSRVEPFADGAMRVARQVASVGKARLMVGGGVWGAAQRDAARLDVGPSAVATLPVGRQAIRLSVDWRERVAGDATPGSGPAVTLGADF